MNNDHPLAYEDDEFMQSTEARPIRILAEYLDPLRRFKAHNIQDTVVFFGSARVLSRTIAQRALTRLETATIRESDHKAALKRSRKALEWSRYYEDARELAVEVVARVDVAVLDEPLVERDPAAPRVTDGRGVEVGVA